MALVDEIIAMMSHVKSQRELFRIHQHAGTLLQNAGATPKPRLRLPILGRVYLAASPYIFAWGLVAPALLWLYYQPITADLFSQYVPADGWPYVAAATFGGAAVLLSLILGRVIRALTRATSG